MNRVVWGERVGTQGSSWEPINKQNCCRLPRVGQWWGGRDRQNDDPTQTILLRYWRGEGGLISLIPASIGTSSFLQKRRAILGISDWLAIVSKRWKPHQKLGLQDFLLICKLRLSEKKNKISEWLAAWSNQISDFVLRQENTQCAVSANANLHQFLHGMDVSGTGPRGTHSPLSALVLFHCMSSSKSLKRTLLREH